MPTNELRPDFFRDYTRLTPAQRELFKRTVRQFADDLKHKRPFRPGLRIKGVHGHPGVFEMTWDMPDGCHLRVRP